MSNILVQSVKRALDALDILTFDDIYREGVGLFEMAKRMGLQPNTLHNLLKTMSTCGYVAQNENGKYIVGPKCEEWGSLKRLSSKKNMEEVLRPALSRLSNRINEVTVFTVLSNGSRFPLLYVEHDNPIKVNITSLENEHIYDKPTGRILIAYADAHGAEAVLQKWGYPRSLWNGIEDDVLFRKTLAELRNTGYSVVYTNNGQIVGLAVPVLDKQGKLAGAVGTYVPVYRCDGKKQEELIELLKKTAEELMDVIE